MELEGDDTIRLELVVFEADVDSHSNRPSMKKVGWRRPVEAMSARIPPSRMKTVAVELVADYRDRKAARWAQTAMAMNIDAPDDTLEKRQKMAGPKPDTGEVVVVGVRPVVG